jgi:hypothetical protein
MSDTELPRCAVCDREAIWLTEDHRCAHCVYGVTDTSKLERALRAMERKR